jgi:hypothetical protein
MMCHMDGRVSLKEDSSCSGQDSNGAPPEYKSRALRLYKPAPSRYKYMSRVHTELDTPSSMLVCDECFIKPLLFLCTLLLFMQSSSNINITASSWELF